MGMGHCESGRTKRQSDKTIILRSFKAEYIDPKKQWKLENKGHDKEYQAEYRKVNRERRREYMRHYNRRK